MCFRPLIRGFFFYKEFQQCVYKPLPFPSPHSGILFLFCIGNYIYDELELDGFRPLIRGFFFYRDVRIEWEQIYPVSVPSFGDSFFIIKKYRTNDPNELAVSVPSFGDSFFIKLNLQKRWRSKWGGFRPLIRGFFFYVNKCRRYSR